MPKYQYQSGSLITEIDVLTNERGGLRAYVHARDGASPASLAALQNELAPKGWIGIPYTHHGKPTLEVRGFHNETELLAFFRDQHAIEGPDAPQALSTDKRSFRDKFIAATLKWSGIGYIFGDAAFMTYAGMELSDKIKDQKIATTLMEEVKAHGYTPAQVQEKTKQLLHTTLKDAKALEGFLPAAKDAVAGGKSKILSGVGYALGSIILAVYGGRDQSATEIKTTTSKIEKFLKRDGVLNPAHDDVLIEQPEQKHGLFGKVHALLKRYPSEALNFVYLAVGLTLMRSSLKEISSLKSKIAPLEGRVAALASERNALEYEKNALASHKANLSEEMQDVGLGLVTAGSALAGIMIKEKKPIEGEKKPDGFFARAWRWIEEKPLRATGFGFMAATGIHAKVTYDKWQPKPDDTPDSLARRRKILSGRGVFIGLNILAEGLMAISSKGHGQGVSTDKSTTDSVLSATAQFVARQDADTQPVLIERLAGYIASPEVLGGKSHDIARQLHEEVAKLKGNPWLEREYEEARVAEPAAVTTTKEAHSPAPLATSSTAPGTTISTAQHMQMLQAPQTQAIAAP